MNKSIKAVLVAFNVIGLLMALRWLSEGPVLFAVFAVLASAIYWGAIRLSTAAPDEVDGMKPGFDHRHYLQLALISIVAFIFGDAMPLRFAVAAGLIGSAAGWAAGWGDTSK